MVIFVKIRNDQNKIYDSYTDYWNLINLSGFTSCEIEEVDYDSDNIYILSPINGNVKLMAQKPRKCKYIGWILERPGSNPGGYIIQGIDKYWVSDRYFHSLINNPMCKYVPIGGHPMLGNNLHQTKHYDLVHLSYMCPRRIKIVDNLKCLGFSMAPNGWGEVRNKSLSLSVRGLCMHQDDDHIIEPLRYTLFSCWQLPIVAEPSKDTYPYKTYALDQINTADDWETNYNRMTSELTFRKCIEEAL